MPIIDTPWRARLLQVSGPSNPCPRPPLPAFLSQHSGPGLPLSAAPTLPLALATHRVLFLCNSWGFMVCCGCCAFYAFYGFYARPYEG